MKSVKEVRAAWAAALRSGKYQQGRGQLRMEDGAMCCMGVLCDVIDPAGWGPGLCWEGKAGMPPLSACALAGLNGEEWILARMNDSERRSFSEIADYIDSRTLPEAA